MYLSALKSNQTTRSGVLGLLVFVFAVLTVVRNADWKSAVTIWADVVKKSPAKERAYNNLGTAFQGQKKYDEALAVYQRALALDPSISLNAYGNIGNVYLDKQEYEKASELFTRILMINANDYQSNIGRGKARYGQERYAEALVDFNRAIKFAPSIARYYLYRAETYLKLKEIERARNDLKRSCDMYWEESCERLKELDKHDE